jgi:hypothetical protein
MLADCLLPEGPIRDLFSDAYRHAGDDQGIRLRLIIADHALKQLPWEYAIWIYWVTGPDSMRGFLALNKSIPSCGMKHYRSSSSASHRHPPSLRNCQC